jgi:hypothetical protein
MEQELHEGAHQQGGDPLQQPDGHQQDHTRSQPVRVRTDEGQQAIQVRIRIVALQALSHSKDALTWPNSIFSGFL